MQGNPLKKFHQTRTKAINAINCIEFWCIGGFPLFHEQCNLGFDIFG